MDDFYIAGTEPAGTEPAGADAPSSPGKGEKAGRALTVSELSAFCGQMAIVLKAGISAYEGITIMRDDAESSEDHALLAKIAEDMELQGSFSHALRSTGVYPEYLIHMVEIGERTGNLDTVMKSLEDHYEREENIRLSTRNAVFYPLILSAMMIAVIIVLLVQVMPVFNDVFRGLGTEMTGFPAFLMNVGNWIRTYSAFFLIVVFAVMLVIFILYRTSAGREALRRFARRFRSVRRSDHALAACRFAGAMSMTLSAGLTPDESLELAIKLNEDPDFGQKLDRLSADVAEGKGFANSLYKNEVFTGIYSRMISIGQKTGSIDQVMGQVADMYQDEIDTRLGNRLATLEPLLVIVMSVVIGAILLSVMFPLLGIMSSI